MPANSNLEPPTPAGVSGYPGVLGTIESSGPAQPIYVAGKWSTDTKPGKYFIVWDNDGALTDLSSFIIPGGIPGTFAAALKLPAGNFRLGSFGAPGSIGVYSGILAQGTSVGRWSIGTPDVDLTKSMIQMAAPQGAIAL